MYSLKSLGALSAQIPTDALTCGGGNGNGGRGRIADHIENKTAQDLLREGKMEALPKF
jgi:hypothetical protein